MTTEASRQNTKDFTNERNHTNDVAFQGWSERLEALSREYFALKEAGKLDEAQAVRAEGLAMINERWGL